MKRIWIVWLVSCLFGGLQPLLAQTSTQFSGWFAEVARVELKNRYSLRVESQFRSTNEMRGLQQWLIRLGLNYDIKRNQIFTIGYGYFSTFRTVSGAGGYVAENRIWEQYVLDLASNAKGHYIKFHNRVRLEQRFIGQPENDNGHLETSNYAFAQRFRYLFRTIFPFPKTATDFKRGTYITLQDELFFNFGDLSVVNGHYFDQNRVYFALGYRFSSQIAYEIEYMNTLIKHSASAKPRHNILPLPPISDCEILEMLMIHENFFD
jgi:hypothetical protein